MKWVLVAAVMFTGGLARASHGDNGYGQLFILELVEVAIPDMRLEVGRAKPTQFRAVFSWPVTLL